jgi:hypothetical protein
MWDVLGGPIKLAGGSFAQSVIWDGQGMGAVPGRARYSIRIDGDAKDEIDKYLVVEGPKGNHVNLLSVVVTFLKQESHFDENPQAVDGRRLTRAKARAILGLNPVGYWKCRQCGRVHPVEFSAGHTGFVGACTSGGPWISILPDEIHATPELAAQAVAQ